MIVENPRLKRDSYRFRRANQRVNGETHPTLPGTPYQSLKTREIMIRHIRSHHDIESAIAYIRNLDTTKRWQIEIKPAKSRRSLSQNSLLWLWNSQIQAHMREHYGEIASAEDWHEILVGRLLPTKVVVFCGEPEVCRTSTRKLSVGEMSAYLEMLEMYCAEHIGLQLSKPEDIYWEALLADKG